MDHDITRRRSVVDREALGSRLEDELQTEIPDESLEAFQNSLDCVCGQLVRAARHGIRREVEALVKSGDFDGIPALHPTHFLRTYRDPSDSPYPAEAGYSVRAQRHAQEVTSDDDAPEDVTTKLR